jgi:hypothetical protein
LEDNRSHRHPENIATEAGVSAKAMAYTSLVTGTGEHTIARILTDVNVASPSSGSFYNALRKLYRIARMQRNMSVRRAQLQMLPGATLSVGVSWNFRRNGSHSIFEAMWWDPRTRQNLIVFVTSGAVTSKDCEAISKTRPGRWKDPNCIPGPRQ